MSNSPTPDQIRLVRDTWSQIVPLAYAFSGQFYERLFTLDPSARGLFEESRFSEQRGKFVQMLGLLVRDLGNPERLNAQVGELGKRHVGYGVREAQYETMEEALLWTLRGALGPAFTPSVRDAWASAYGSWATLMRSAGRSGPPATRPDPLPAEPRP